MVLGTISNNMAQKNIILRLFLAFFSAKRLFEIALPWQYIRSQVIKNYVKGCAVSKKLKVTKFQLSRPKGF